MIVDASAVLAILFREAGFEVFERSIAAAPSCSISAVSFVEVSVVVESRGGDQGVLYYDAFFRSAGITIEPVTQEQAFLARQGYFDYGKGRHAAGLNLGDCFSYALARVTGEPLLFKGDDFSKTDVKSALS